MLRSSSHLSSVPLEVCCMLYKMLIINILFSIENLLFGMSFECKNSLAEIFSKYLHTFYYLNSLYRLY